MFLLHDESTDPFIPFEGWVSTAPLFWQKNTETSCATQKTLFIRICSQEAVGLRDQAYGRTCAHRNGNKDARRIQPMFSFSPLEVNQWDTSCGGTGGRKVPVSQPTGLNHGKKRSEKQLFTVRPVVIISWVTDDLKKVFWLIVAHSLYWFINVHFSY